MSGKSRFICLHGGQRRDRADNRATLFGPIPLPDPPPAFTQRDAFLRAYPVVREASLAFGQVGVVVAAVDRATGRLAGSLCLAARPGEPAVAIIGRHGEADLFLDADPALSLRHLALVVHPLTSWDTDGVRYSVLDLRTPAAFSDEQGRRLEGVMVEGPAFLGCGRYALVCLLTGDPTDWPEVAEDAWDLQPEPVHLKHDAAEPDRWMRDDHSVSWRRAPGGGLRRLRSCITHVPGPAWARGPLIDPGEPEVGRLTTTTAHASRTVGVGARQLAQGILLGRYERCDGAPLMDDVRVSRVHLMIRSIAGRTYAIDTASTHRTYVSRAEGSDRVRVLPLDGPTELVLGDDLARIRWTAA